MLELRRPSPPAHSEAYRGKMNRRRNPDVFTDKENQQYLIDRRNYSLEVGNKRTIDWKFADGHTEQRDIHVPSEHGHYDNVIFDWDTRMGVSMMARDGKVDAAAKEFDFYMQLIDPTTGFNTNKRRIPGRKPSLPSRFEYWFANDSQYGNSYTQPPIHAWAAMDIYKGYVAKYGEEEGASKGRNFLEKVYGQVGNKDEDKPYVGLAGAYAYFEETRQNIPGEDPLIGLTSKYETGLDNSRANHMQGKNIGLASAGKDLFVAKRTGKDPEGERKDYVPEQMRKEYWLNDVMVNALYVKNLRYMSEIADIIGKHDDKATYETMAEAVEKRILADNGSMWRNEEKDKGGFFYNLNKNGEQIDVASISGLFPLLLKNIDTPKLDPLLAKLEDPEWFGTAYPVPTQAALSDHFKAKKGIIAAPPWNGNVWINLNHFLVEEGLLMQAQRFRNTGDTKRFEKCMRIADTIKQATTKMQLQNTHSMEAYAYTPEGKRKKSPRTIFQRVEHELEEAIGARVRGFMWSNLRFEKFEAYQEEMGLAA